jgi:Fe-S cluster biogenesis protein NfuA
VDAGSGLRSHAVIEQDSVLTALEEIRSLVRPDGADFELVTLDPATGAVNLRLVLDDASCRECVMPRPILEDIATSMVRKTVPDVARLSIDDPREREGDG